jgi:exonuclease SbcD
MKILHTSDWHLGHRLHEHSQNEEHALFLQWLSDYISRNQIDVLLLAGDVFDTGAPSAQSLKLYYDFLVNLRQTNCKSVFITGGNHDAPGTLDAPKELLSALSVHVVGKATEELCDEVFIVECNGERLQVAAVPFLRDQDIRRAVAGESFDQITERYKRALVRHYHEVARICRENGSEKTLTIAMGHLFAIGGKVSDSEQSIYVGNLGDIEAEDFPETFDYMALGHLHRPQKVGGKEHIRYSGSPLTLSFSEVNQEKQVLVIETADAQITGIHPVAVPAFRRISRICGTYDECVAKLQLIAQQEHVLTPWVEVILEREPDAILSYTDINKVAEPLNIEVLRVSYSQINEVNGAGQFAEQEMDINDLDPVEVFRLKCREEGFDLEEHPEIGDAFHEILQLVQGQ